MIIPAFANVKFTDEEGFLTSQMQMYNDELNRVLRNGLSDNGWTIPQVTAAQLTQINAFTDTQILPNGTIWYVSDAVPPTLVVKMDDGTGMGVSALYKITTTAYP
jgi:hypothetical protein